MLLLGRTLSPSTKVTSLCLRSVRTRFATCSIIGELKRVVLKPPAFFVYLGDDPEIAAHTPLLLFGHVLFLHGREYRVGMGGLEPRPDNRPVVPVGQGGGLSALSLCLDRPALRRRVFLLPQPRRAAPRTAGRELRRGLYPVLCVIETDGRLPL